MSTMESLIQLVGFNANKVSKEQQLIIEAELFSRICFELKEHFRKEYSNYFRIMKYNLAKENEMLEGNFTKLVIKDILLSEEYTIEGLSQYTGIHVDIFHEVISGRNNNPSAELLQRAIEIHRKIRGDLYKEITNKLIRDCLEDK